MGFSEVKNEANQIHNVHRQYSMKQQRNLKMPNTISRTTKICRTE